MGLELIVTSIIGGIVATYVLLAMAAWSHRLGLPRLDFAKAMAGLTYGQSFEGRDPPYWAGAAVVYMNGILFALVYSTAVAQYLPGPPVVRGIIWGIVLYLVSCSFFVPVYLREGFFLAHVHRNAWITSGMVHGLWGIVVGWLCPIRAAAAS